VSGINKKLWSFNFGCLIAGSFVWLVGLGATAPVPELLSAHPIFVLDYYSGLVTALFAMIFTTLLVGLMTRWLKICSSEHTFWLMLPSLSFVALTSLSAFNSLPEILFAALPSLLILLSASVLQRFLQQRKVTELQLTE
jgi:hypothetical protein